jgi:hypothetical protein
MRKVQPTWGWPPRRFSSLTGVIGKGLERALYERPRTGKAMLPDTQQRQRIMALVCGPPPARPGIPEHLQLCATTK